MNIVVKIGRGRSVHVALPMSRGRADIVLLYSNEILSTRRLSEDLRDYNSKLTRVDSRMRSDVLDSDEDLSTGRPFDKLGDNDSIPKT